MTAKNPFDLSGRVALVTGGNGGLGRSMALGFANAGASVAIFGRKEAKNAAVLAELQSIGVRAMALTVDMTNDPERDAAFAQVEKTLGPVHIVVNNAGAGVFKPALEETREGWQEISGHQPDSDVPVFEDGGAFHVEAEGRKDHQYRKHVLAIWVGRGSRV